MLILIFLMLEFNFLMLIYFFDASALNTRHLGAPVTQFPVSMKCAPNISISFRQIGTPEVNRGPPDLSGQAPRLPRPVKP